MPKMQNITSNRSASPIRQTLMTGGAMVMAMTFAMIAVQSYAQDTQHTDGDMMEITADTVDDAANADKAAGPAMDAEKDEAPIMISEDAPSEEQLETEMMDGETDTVLECPEGTEVQPNQTCMVIGEGWDAPEE